MALVISSPADVVNASLVRIGWKGFRVGNLYDGSDAANTALDIYGETRDELLRAFDWGFAERNINLTLLKQAPDGGYFPPNAWDPTVNPPPPWFFEYSYPQDCLKVRSIKPVPMFVQNFDPQPNVFAVENDQTFSPPQKVILCNVASAQLVYTAQITDPLTWEADFADEFITKLGKRLAPSLASLDVAKMAAVDDAEATITAESQRG